MRRLPIKLVGLLIAIGFVLWRTDGMLLPGFLSDDAQDSGSVATLRDDRSGRSGASSTQQAVRSLEQTIEMLAGAAGVTDDSAGTEDAQSLDALIACIQEAGGDPAQCQDGMTAQASPGADGAAAPVVVRRGRGAGNASGVTVFRPRH